MVKFRIVQSNPLEQDSLIQEILKHLPIRDTFRLSPISKSWHRVSKSPEFHPTKLDFIYCEAPRFQTIDFHWNPTFQVPFFEIPASRQRDLAHATDCIRYLDTTECLVDPAFFTKIDELEVTFEIDRHDKQRFFAKIFPLIRTLTIDLELTEDVEELLSEEFAKLEEIQILVDTLPNLDYREKFPKLRLVSASLDDETKIPKGMDEVENVELSWVYPESIDEQWALDVSTIKGAKRVLICVHTSKGESRWSELCQRMKLFLEEILIPSLKHLNEIVFLRTETQVFEGLDVHEMIPENLKKYRIKTRKCQDNTLDIIDRLDEEEKAALLNSKI